MKKELNIDRLIDDSFSIYHLTGVIRYNNQFMLRQENVAEHSYMVSAITEMICSGLNVDPKTHLEALRYSIIHDVPEAHTGDIIASTKSYLPTLSGDLSELELRIISDRFPYLYSTYSELHNEKNTLARDIMKLADYISVKVCMNRESMLGNRAGFIDAIHRDVDIKIEAFTKRVLDALNA